MPLQDFVCLPGEAGGYRSMKPGLKFARTPASVRRDPPSLGQHTDEVLSQVLGLEGGEIARLHDAGVVAGPEGR